MFVEHFLDLPRIGFQSPNGDHVLLAVGDEKVAFFIKVPDVSREEETLAIKLAKHQCILVGTVPVALHDLGAANGNLPVLSRGKFFGSRLHVHDLHVGSRHGKSHRAKLPVLFASRVGVGHGCRLREPVALEKRGAGLFFEALGHFHGQRGGSGPASHQRTQVELFQQGMVRHGVVDSGHRVQDGCPVLFYQAQHLGKLGIAGPRVRHAHKPCHSPDGHDHGKSLPVAVEPGNHSHETVLPRYHMALHLIFRIL